MSASMLTAVSDAMADGVARAAPAVVQVLGRRRPASGVTYAESVVVTTTRALGREDGLRVRSPEGALLDAEMGGWDPATGLAVLQVPALKGTAARPAEHPPRVGHLAVALARSWSNAVTASAGIVSIIGGPLPTGHRQSIAEVIRTTAPMHEGFAGGALMNTEGHLIGITTAAVIRGLGVVIPTDIAWRTAATLIEHGGVRRGYLGIAGQAARLPEAQRQQDDRNAGLLVIGVTHGSPAAAAGLLVGDLILDFDGAAVTSPEDLLDLLVGERVGHTVAMRLLRGTSPVMVSVTIGERPSR